jgi:hypothetical protein
MALGHMIAQMLINHRSVSVAFCNEVIPKFLEANQQNHRPMH